jgi:high-affinity iron transporter
MTKNLFSIPIFFIVFRETLEAAIIVSVLLGLAEQIVSRDPTFVTNTQGLAEEDAANGETGVDDSVQRRRLLRRMRIQIFLGAGIGFFIALSIGAGFIAVWFTKAADLWSKSEDLWEGIFEIIACVMIFVMGITMLKMDRAKAKWRVKLQNAFDGKKVDGRTRTGKWVLFILPLITVLREGLEAVIFVGGVSLGLPAASIPIAAIVGIVCGVVIGFFIYEFASRTTLSIFLVVMTNFLLLIGAGLFSKGVGSFQTHAFNTLLGTNIDDTGGDGPGTYRVQGNVWHLDCCNPENNMDGQGWSIFNAILGWTNSATVGTVLSYVFYWLAVIAVLVYTKYKEGRTKVFGFESEAGMRIRQRREEKALNIDNGQVTPEKDSNSVKDGNSAAGEDAVIEALPR